MFSFDDLWRDYAVYTPALQTYYTSFVRLAQATPPLPSGLEPADLDFLSPLTRLFKLRDALMSAGVVMDGAIHRLRDPPDDMVGHRDRASTYLTADSGGFQVLTKGLRIDNDLRLAQLRVSGLAATPCPSGPEICHSARTVEGEGDVGGSWGANGGF